MAEVLTGPQTGMSTGMAGQLTSTKTYDWAGAHGGFSDAAAEWRSRAAENKAYDQFAVGQNKREPPYVNPEISKYMLPAPDMLSFAGKDAKLFRGWLIEDPGPNPPTPIPLNERYRLNFHMNPQTINESWRINADVPPIGNIGPAEGQGLVTEGVGFAFNLIFDRRGQQGKGADAVPEGVLADMRILSKILTAGTGGQGTKNTSLYQTTVRLVISRMEDSMIHDRAERRTAIPYPLGATGYITGCNVDYTWFNHDMTPLVAVVALSMQVIHMTPAQAMTYTGMPSGSTTAAAPSGGGGGSVSAIPPTPAGKAGSNALTRQLTTGEVTHGGKKKTNPPKPNWGSSIPSYARG